jgi:hypothetical protein
MLRAPGAFGPCSAGASRSRAHHAYIRVKPCVRLVCASSVGGPLMACLGASIRSALGRLRSVGPRSDRPGRFQRELRPASCSRSSGDVWWRLDVAAANAPAPRRRTAMRGVYARCAPNSANAAPSMRALIDTAARRDSARSGGRWRRLRVSVPDATFKLWLRPCARRRHRGHTLRKDPGRDPCLGRGDGALISQALARWSWGCASQLRARVGGWRRRRGRGSPQPHFSYRFVIGEGNLAHAAPGCRGSAGAWPLFLHGPPGLGKTHLLARSPTTSRALGLNVPFSTAEVFTNEFVLRCTPPGRRSSSIATATSLLIDVVRLEAHRRGFFHTFITLYEAGASSLADHASQRAVDPRARLRDTFEWGLSCGRPPNLATRLIVLRRLVREANAMAHADARGLRHGPNIASWGPDQRHRPPRCARVAQRELIKEVIPAGRTETKRCGAFRRTAASFDFPLHRRPKPSRAPLRPPASSPSAARCDLSLPQIWPDSAGAIRRFSNAIRRVKLC